MARRSVFAFVLVILALLALAVPALAGGWAVVTLDALPREVRASEHLQLGFMVLQHGKTPTNKDLNGKLLTPVLTASKQGVATIRAEAQQQGATGHYVVDLTLPSAGSWAWQIALPTYYVQDSPSGNNAAVFAPLTVLPAAAPAPVLALTPEATSWLGLNSVVLRWAGLAGLLAALAIGVYAQRGIVRRRAARSQ